MHRQSLGSPASKLQSHGVQSEQPTTKDDNSASSSSDRATDNEQRKTQKPNQQKSLHESSSSSSNKLVHIIPILTFLCFLILYLSSHDPSNTDLGQTQFSGFATLSSKKTETDDSVGGGSLAIRNVRKLLEQRQRRRFHKKLWQQS
ncbi:hypothetical protein M8C21_016664 [Ambrosia artemisiifolia]|uniref:Uncharacterized protein n=1 Tax=Ambrosia artemisiifolia TaxID=4212 RepID=A0AAD5BUH3_AMBAR|nr:hypothetical protein M8C21_016664 [Ambrosia artemisiifolia]